MLQRLFADLRYALRQFRRAPVFTITATLTLALGMGATTAIFTLVHAIMLRSLPVADPATLYRVGEGVQCCVEGGLQNDWGLFSYALYDRIQAATPEFDQLAAFEAMAAQFSVRGGSADLVAKPLRGEFVTGNYFSMFGVGAFAGRVFTPTDDKTSAAPVAVLSYRTWQQTYGSDPSVLGSTFIVEGRPFTIIGISPPGFFGDTLRSNPPELWLPLQQEKMLNGSSSLLLHPNTSWLRIIGRLKPGASTAGMGERLTALLRHWLTTESGYPAEFMSQIERAIPNQNIKIIPAGAGIGTMQANFRDSLRILFTVCSLVLLIACANIANLLLARGMARRANAALRLALGASRSQIMRQTLTESILLGLMGGAAGIALAYLGAQAILLLEFGKTAFVPIDVSPSLPIPIPSKPYEG
jgi:predicted permease